MSDWDEEGREPQIDWHGERGAVSGFFGCVGMAGGLFLTALGGTCTYMGFSSGMC